LRDFLKIGLFDRTESPIVVELSKFLLFWDFVLPILIFVSSSDDKYKREICPLLPISFSAFVMVSEQGLVISK